MEPAKHTPGLENLPSFPRATEIPFPAFLNRYEGKSCTIVGRGPTEFDYARLGDTDDPVFFINDAICLENRARGDTFFFAHDPQLLPWLDGNIKSTAVLPIDGKMFRRSPGATFNHAGQIVFYHWREEKKEALLLMPREQIAQLKQLYTHTGTIHSVLHFIWFCGFKKVTFIGCDGITARGYDPRLANVSGSSASPTYPAILRAQKLLTMLFGLEAVYVRTPEENAER
jgi:hypothetical protein